MNPELQRNLWLEITPHRLLLIPGIILGIALLFHYVDPSDSVVRPVALFGFVLLAVVWGARQAANSILDEARDRTWDTQRMSALSPWAMTWGKLAGATVMSWYGGLWCLLVFVGGGSRDGLAASAMAAALIVFAAIAAQSATLTGALVGMHMGRRAQARLSNIAVILLLAFLLPNLLQLVDEGKTVVWYGDVHRQLPFALGSAIAFAAWGVVGALRTMCMELQVRTRPWLWPAFALFIAWYVTGFTVEAAIAPLELARRLCSSTTAVAVVLSYFAAFAFARDPIQYRRVLRTFADGNYGRAFEELPLWIASAVPALMLGGGALLFGSAPELSNERPDNLGPVALAYVLMMLRDLALLLFFSLRARTGRGEAATLIYMAILDFLLPAILTQLGLRGAASLVMPALFDAPYFAIIVFAVHAAIAGTLAVRAYRRSTTTVNQTGDRLS